MNVFNSLIKSYSGINIGDKKKDKNSEDLKVTFMKIEDISNLSTKIHQRKMSNDYSANFNLNNNTNFDDIFTDFTYLIILVHNYVNVLIYGINVEPNSKNTLLYNKCFNEYISFSSLNKKDYNSLICYDDDFNKNQFKLNNNSVSIVEDKIKNK